jgi:hypothetical protein
MPAAHAGTRSPSYAKACKAGQGNGIGAMIGAIMAEAE